MERFVRAYIDALDLTAIAVLGTSDAGPVVIRFGKDPAAIAKRSAIEIKSIRWCERSEIAGLIVTTCKRDLPCVAGDWIEATPLIALKAIEIVAGEFRRRARD